MQRDSEERDGGEVASLTEFIDTNQRLLAVLSVFVAVIVLSGQIDSAWANVFRGTFVLLALIVWLEIISNYRVVGEWWRMPPSSVHPRDWLGQAQRVYWFGVLMVVGFVSFCLYLIVTFPVTSLYVLLAFLHTPLHLYLLRRCLSLGIFRRRSDRTAGVLASVLSGAVTLGVLAIVALVLLAVIPDIA